jgi:hypothetical protein
MPLEPDESDDASFRLTVRDRDAAMSRLRTAFATGWITAREFDERFEQARGARVAAELAEVLCDLPPEPAVTVIPSTFNVVAIAGGVVLDLRKALFLSRETIVRAYGVLGVLRVIVPEGVEVTNGGDTVVRAPDTARTWPVVRISGGGVLGFTTVEVCSTGRAATAGARRWRRSLHWWLIRFR